MSMPWCQEEGILHHFHQGSWDEPQQDQQQEHLNKKIKKDEEQFIVKKYNIIF